MKSNEENLFRFLYRPPNKYVKISKRKNRAALIVKIESNTNKNNNFLLKTKQNKTKVVNVLKNQTNKLNLQKINTDTNEIDDLFSNFKKKPIEQIQPKLAIESEEDISKDIFFDSRGTYSQKRKIIGGLKIYTVDELNLGKGGNTPLCPFDCDCCF
eukprot:TRINITY_DN424_c3_g1_i2.p1 TRINITY_DN424_c3_g1~~TRINITY_DN424_c3_g1_i2.p1  ORF type:complete len:156 (+),score=49.44 TRINITY_DN424_c3_g1_i2:71-538(+)